MGQQNYEFWKVLVWRFVRAGVSGGISSLLAVQIVLHADLSNVKVYGYALAAAFGTGFISALGLAVREYFGDSNKGQGVVNKIPV